MLSKRYFPPTGFKVILNTSKGGAGSYEGQWLEVRGAVTCPLHPLGREAMACNLLAMEVVSLLLVVRPGAPSSVLAPSSDALCS